jgi:hypothetical protein
MPKRKAVQSSCTGCGIFRDARKPCTSCAGSVDNNFSENAVGVDDSGQEMQSRDAGILDEFVFDTASTDGYASSGSDDRIRNEFIDASRCCEVCF